MKRVLLCVMFLLIASSSNADIQEFRYFSIDVPEGWEAVESGDVVEVTANDKSGSLLIVAGDPKGNSAEELAVLSALELNGTVPVSDDEGNYTFECNNGVSQAILTYEEDFYMLIIGTGFVSNGETLGAILDSLEMK